MGGGGGGGVRTPCTLPLDPPLPKNDKKKNIKMMISNKMTRKAL